MLWERLAVACLALGTFIVVVLFLLISLAMMAAPFLLAGYAFDRCAYGECVEHHTPEKCR
jgi:hypothetical protein